MKKIYTLIITTVLFSINVNAQSFVWAKSMGGVTGAGDFGTSVTVDALGNVYSTGYFFGTADFDPGAGVFNLTSAGGYDIFVSKLDASGNFVYAKQLGGPADDRAFSITSDGFGNVYATGYFSNTGDFDPGPGVFNLTNPGNQVIFVSKLDASGNFVWAKGMGISGTARGLSIKTDGSANVYLTGHFTGTVDFDPGASTYTLASTNIIEDLFVSKLDASGNFLWADRIGGTGSEVGNAIAVDASGNVYTTGYFQATVDFDPGAGTFNLFTPSSSSTDAFISKLNSSGNFVWAKSFSGNTEKGYGITLDASGNIYTTGYFSGTTDFDPGAATYYLASTGSTDVFVSKLNSSGAFVWAKRMGTNTSSWSTEAYGIGVDGSGNVYTTGRFSGTSDFDPGAGTYTLSAGTNYGAFISKLDASGNFVWASELGFPTETYGNALALDGAANIYTTGRFYGTGDFDPGTGVFNLSSPALGDYDVFVHKMANCSSAPAQPSTISGNAVICSGVNNTYSVTFVSATSYIWSLPGGWTGTSTTNIISTTPSTTSGIISVTAVNPCGSSPVQTLAVTVGSIPPTPGPISGNTSVCSASANNYSVTSIPNATSYNWFGPSGWTGISTTNIITVTVSTTSGNLSVTATNSCGTSPVQTLSVTVNTAPTTPSTISGNISICSGSSNSYSVAAVSGATSYTWVKPGGWTGTSSTNIINTTASSTSGNLTVTATNACGTSAAQTLSVTVNSNPTANAGSSQTITCTPANVNLIGSGVTSYTWSGPGIVSGGNTASPVVNMAGTYSLVGSTSGCNSNTATVIVSTNTTAPSLSVTASSNSICIGSSATLTASGANTYSWSTSATTTSIVVSPTTTTNYILSGTNTANGCTNTINQSIGVNPLPVVTATTSASVICGPPFQGTATITVNGASTYTWNTTATTTAIAVSPSITTVYTVTGTDANGCVNTTSFTQSVSACTGIDVASTGSATEIIIYPNPTSGVVNMKAKEGLQVQVYNVIGELILNTELKTESTELDLSGKANGIYFIRIGSVTKKITKE